MFERAGAVLFATQFMDHYLSANALRKPRIFLEKCLMAQLYPVYFLRPRL